MYYLLNRFCFSRSRPLLLTFAGFGLCPLLLSDSRNVLGCVPVDASSNEDRDRNEQTGHIAPSAHQRDILLTAELARFRRVAC
jgi:hypothetical protein